MELWQKIAIGVAAFILAVVMYYVFVAKTNPITALLGKKVYYSQTTIDFVRANNLDKWRDPADDEWNSMCGQMAAGFGYQVCPADSTKVSGSTVLSWFKAMNINPIRHMGLVVAAGTVSATVASAAKNDIYNYWKTVPQKYWKDVAVGEAFLNQPNA